MSIRAAGDFENSVIEFVKSKIAPIAESMDKTNRFPREVWKEFGSLQLLGVTVNKADGGSELGYRAQTFIIETISRYSAALGLSYGAHANLCVNQIARLGTSAQKQRYLPKLISGEWIGALAMSEKEAGSDVLSMQLEAKEKEDHYLLNGEKMWITNGPEADVIIVYAKTDPTAGPHGISAFIIENTFHGFSAGEKLDKLGMRGSDTSALYFNQCKVPKENLLGKYNYGLSVLMSGLDYERAVLSAGPLGLMHACFDLMLPYVKQRKQFQKSIGEFELIQEKVANLYTKLQAARSYVYHTAHICDQGNITPELAASTYLFVSENATQAALDTIQCLGGIGYLNQSPAGRLLRDAKLYEIGAGTVEIRKILIARQLMKKGVHFE